VQLLKAVLGKEAGGSVVGVGHNGVNLGVSSKLFKPRHDLTAKTELHVIWINHKVNEFDEAFLGVHVE